MHTVFCYLGGSLLDYTDSEKDLGILMNRTQNFTEHSNYLFSRANQRSWLKRLTKWANFIVGFLGSRFFPIWPPFFSWKTYIREKLYFISILKVSCKNIKQCWSISDLGKDVQAKIMNWDMASFVHFNGFSYKLRRICIKWYKTNTVGSGEQKYWYFTKKSAKIFCILHKHIMEISFWPISLEF